MATTEQLYSAAAPTAANIGLKDPKGWAKQQGFTPAMLGQGYDNPWYYLPYSYKGINQASAGYQGMRDLGGDPLTLFNVQQGGQGNLASKDAGDFANYMNDLFQSMGTPGAKPFDAKALFGQLFGQKKFGADADTTLGMLLGAGDVPTRSRTAYSLARDLANMSMNPIAARGMQQTISQGLDQYGSASMSQNASQIQNPTQYLADKMPWLVQGMK